MATDSSAWRLVEVALLLWSRRSRTQTDRLIEEPNDLPFGWCGRTDRALYLKTVMQIQLEVDGRCRIVLFEEWVEPVKHTWAVGKGV
jgi:hypothetical protein